MSNLSLQRRSHTLICPTYFSDACSPYYHDETYFYDMASESWTRGPDMSRARYYHTCNLVTHEDGTQDIVIIGGAGDSRCSYGNKHVDIVHLGDNNQALDIGNNDSCLQKSVDY